MVGMCIHSHTSWLHEFKWAVISDKPEKVKGYFYPESIQKGAWHTASSQSKFPECPVCTVSLENENVPKYTDT